MRRGRAGARRFVEALLRDRRPPRFEADPEEARLLEVATTLRGARAATDLPSEEFVSRLERRLRSELEAAPPSRRLPSRRRFLLGGGLAAAAVAAGVATDLSLHHEGEDRTQEELVPVAGTWLTVARLADLADGRPRRFQAGPVQGVLVPATDGGVRALSAVCTQMAPAPEERALTGPAPVTNAPALMADSSDNAATTSPGRSERILRPPFTAATACRAPNRLLPISQRATAPNLAAGRAPDPPAAAGAPRGRLLRSTAQPGGAVAAAGVAGSDRQDLDLVTDHA